MKLRNSKVPRQRILRSCVPDKFAQADEWTSVDKLINTLSTRGIPTAPELILSVARSGLKLQIFDSKLWELVSSNTLSSKELYTPTQWVELLHIYKRIKTRNPELFNVAAEQINGRLNVLSLRDLSLLTLSFSYFMFCPRGLFKNIADLVCNRTNKSIVSSTDTNKIVLGVFESSAEFIGTERSENNYKLKNNEVSSITSYAHLLGSYSKCGFEHRQLFEVVAESLLCKLSTNNALIPTNILLKLLTSYSRFGYKHTKLLDALSLEMITSKISIQELNNVKLIFEMLNYENNVMNNIFSFRLGNAKE